MAVVVAGNDCVRNACIFELLLGLGRQVPLPVYRHLIDHVPKVLGDRQVVVLLVVDDPLHLGIVGVGQVGEVLRVHVVLSLAITRVELGVRNNGD